MSKVVDKVFKSHPKAEVVFTTSDDMPFLNEHNAKMHAKTLKNKTVTPHKRKAELTEEEKANREAEKAKKAEDKAKKELNIQAVKNGEPNANLKDSKVSEVSEWAEKQTEVEVLKKALTTVESKGGKAAIGARIEAIENKNVEGNQAE